MPVIGAVAVPHPPLIIPEVGKGDEKEIQSTIDAYEKAMQFVAALKPDTVVIATPHTTSYSDYIHISPGARAHGSFSRFRAPQVEVEVDYDTDMVDEICQGCKHRNLSAGTLGEQDPLLDHATMIPLYFLTRYYHDFSVVRIGISGLSLAEHYELGQIIANVSNVQKKKVVFIGSGDLSHKLKDDGPYGFAKEGQVFDRIVVDALSKADFLSLMNIDPDICEKAAECGHKPFIMMAGALDCLRLESSLLSYEGPFGVGYGVATFKVTGVDESRNICQIYLDGIKKASEERMSSEDAFVSLARTTLETYVKSGRMIDIPDNLPEELVKTHSAVFVSLKKFGQLRGCIGTLSPVTSCTAEEIIRNAISAGMHDPRFPPLTASELPYLVYSVDVLSEPVSVPDTSSLDPKKYGVIVSAGSKRGVLLPDLEGVDSVEQQIQICRRKGGIAPDESVSLERFTVIRHH